MKQVHKLVILLLFAGAIVSCKKDDSPTIKVASEMDIVDPEFRSYLIANFDTNVDFKLSATEIWAVTEIFLNDSKVHSLEGIKIFNNLTKIKISNNKVRTIDFSKNVNLTFIGIYENQSPLTIYLSESQRRCKIQYEDSNITVVYQ